MSATRAAIYVRISQDRTGAGLGVERQEEDCRDLAERLGWTVVEVYSDNDTSAYRAKSRPEYTRMMGDIQAGNIDGVIAWHPDRLHRSHMELGEFINIVNVHGVKLNTVHAGYFDLSDPTGQATAVTIAAWAQHESQHKAQRIQRASAQRAKAGKFHGGRRPYGFEADGVTVRESEAAELRKMVADIVAGVSLRQVVRDLRTRGVPRGNGKTDWVGQTVRDMITSPRIAGLRTYQGEVIGKAEWPALVPEESWRAAAAILNDPKRRTTPGPAPRWLGSGLYVCGACGQARMRVSVSGSGRRPTYRCAARDESADGGPHVSRAAEFLDEYVEWALVERLKSSDVAELLAATGTEDDDPSELRAEAVAVSERLDQLAGLFAAGDITAAQLATGTERLRARADEIEGELAVLGRRSPLSAVAGAANIERLWFGPKRDGVGGLPLGARRAVLDALAVVTVERAPRGRGGFDPAFVRIDWKA